MTRRAAPALYIRSVTTGSGVSLNDLATQTRLAQLLLAIPTPKPSNTPTTKAG